MPNTTPTLDSIFTEAVEVVDAAQRGDFLAKACGDDTTLRQRVEALLAAHFRAGSFLEQPAPTPVFADVLPDCPDDSGTIIGSYRLLEKIGEGGMGVVYVAEQTEPVRRRVALKVIKPGMDSKEVIARFEAERQALAMMDHPNIAKVFDGGLSGEPDAQARESANNKSLACASGSSRRPYFVMELVRGLPITEYCDQAQLSAERRLKLFTQVCRAVQHAHQKGVIHRDLKPQNVLVTLHDGEPVPKVIDFGVAKALNQRLTDKSVYTRFTELVGTPLYMSPEQAELSALDVDTRSDVYSLGVLLYELLTGTTPFDPQRFREAGFDEMRRIIREDEPPRPSARISTLDAAARSTVSSKRGLDERQLSRMLHGDIDWIVMKALEKDRNRRYESAGAFAADIECYLTYEPVQARPPSASYRLRKFIRRNRGLAATFVLILLAAVGAVTSAVLIDFQKQRAEHAVNDLQEAYLQVRRALDDMSSQVIDDWLARQPELQPEQRAFLGRVAQHYERLAASSATDTDTKAGVADAYLRIGDMRAKLGETLEAETAYGRAAAMYEKLVREVPEVSSHKLALARSHRGRGVALHRIGQDKQATEELERALALSEQNASDAPNDPACQYELADTLSEVGALQSEGRELNKAEQSYVRALQVLGEPAGDAARTPNATRRVAEVYIRLGRLQYWGFRRDADGESSLRRGINLLTGLAESGGSGSDTVAYRDTLASGLTQWAHTLGVQGLNRPDEAANADRRAISIRERLAADFPTVPAYRYRLAESLCGLGNHLQDLRQYSDAIPQYQRAIDLAKRLADVHQREPRGCY